jgi:hypothetical protein
MGAGSCRFNGLVCVAEVRGVRVSRSVLGYVYGPDLAALGVPEALSSAFP